MKTPTLAQHPLLVCSSVTRRRPFIAEAQKSHANSRRCLRCVCRSLDDASVTGSSGSLQLRITSKKVLKQLSSLNLAIGELAAIAGLSIIGTLIKQNEAAEYYVQNYSESSLLSFRLIWALQWDHIYTANYFLALLALLSASLAACSFTRQWPMVKVARRWRFVATAQRVAASGSQENSVSVPDADVSDLGRLLRAGGYAVFLKKGSLYAFKGLAGRFAPIGVHISMLAIILGVAVGGLGGLEGSAMVPEDGDFNFAEALRPKSFLAAPSTALRQSRLHVDKFNIDYRADGSIGQFRSNVSILPGQGRPIRKEISVNDPLRYQGLTAYQTDWSIAALTLQVKGSEMLTPNGAAVRLPVARLEEQPGTSGKLWATFLPSKAPSSPDAKPRGVSMLMRDMQAVVIYDGDGTFVGVRRPGSGRPIQAEGLEITIEDMVGSTGLELKVDPGIPYVYAGFAGLMITTAVSYLSHSQIWALQEGSWLHVSGKTNRAKAAFEQEMVRLVDAIPEEV